MDGTFDNEIMHASNEVLVKRIAELEAEVQRLRIELITYGYHRADCGFEPAEGDGCDCGWVEVRDAIDAAKKGGE